MINIDGSVIIQIVNFVTLIFILNFVLYKPIRNVLIQRKEKVKGLENRIETFSEDAKEKDIAFKSGVSKARAKGLREKESLIEDAAEEEKKIITEINEKAQVKLAEVKEKIVKDTEKARVSLQKEIGEFANGITQKILGRAI